MGFNRLKQEQQVFGAFSGVHTDGRRCSPRFSYTSRNQREWICRLVLSLYSGMARNNGTGGFVLNQTKPAIGMISIPDFSA